MTKEVFEKGAEMFGLMKMADLMYIKSKKFTKEIENSQKEFEKVKKDFDKWLNEKVDF